MSAAGTAAAAGDTTAVDLLRAKHSRRGTKGEMMMMMITQFFHGKSLRHGVNILRYMCLQRVGGTFTVIRLLPYLLALHPPQMKALRTAQLGNYT